MDNRFKFRPKSPCKKVCRIVDGVCIGCKRTMEEVSKWSRMTKKQQWEVIDRIEKKCNND